MNGRNIISPKLAAEIKRFKRNVHRRYLSADNSRGDLAWRESWQMMSLLEVYRTAADSCLLDEFIVHADAVWSWRDHLRGKSCEVRQRSMPSWGSATFSGGKWHVWLVHAGTIIAPIAEFVRLVLSDNRLHAQYLKKAQQYQLLIKETCEAFDEDWVEEEDGGFYKFPTGYFAFAGAHPPPALDPHPLPINMYCAFAMMLIDFTSSARMLRDDHTFQKYNDRAVRMARFTLKEFRPRETADTYVWDYGFGHMQKLEDTSHGGLTVMFVLKAFREGIVFTEAHMRRFANTFVKNIVHSDGSLSRHVDGTEDGSKIQNAGFFWIDLSEIDGAVYAPCHELIVKRNMDLEQLGFAKSIRLRVMNPAFEQNSR